MVLRKSWDSAIVEHCTNKGLGIEARYLPNKPINVG